MRVLVCISLLFLIGASHCGVISSPQVLTQLPTALTTTRQLGGNFAYSTIESRAVPSIVRSPIALPVTYATVAQPLQSIFGSPFFHPFYPGIVGQAPVVGQYPIFGQPPFVGQIPGQGQAPAQPPAAAPPQGVPQGPAPPPPGAVVDDDTVSVEAP